jgi:pimeloyl-ACP methyl ester carboxylesterase
VSAAAGFAITEHTLASARHTTGYLACGRENGPPIVFVHGWPELSHSWRHQLPCFASLGFRAIAPDLRGYGRSSVYREHESYALEHVVADMLELLDGLGQPKAVWVGHDWGSPVVWSLASHHPERCHAVANLCVPYFGPGFTPANLLALVDRRVYPESEYPVGQWDYQLFYLESFDKARQTFEANPRNTVKALFRKGNPKAKGTPSRTATVRKAGGWFGGAVAAPDVPLDTDVLTEDDLNTYSASLARNGFFGPDSYYMNPDRNADYARRAKNGGRLDLPVLFLHGEYDYTCETVNSRLAEPMRQDCAHLTEALAKWLATAVPGVWPV